MRAGLYVRVSTGQQEHALQLDDLRRAAAQRGYVVTEYADVGSGSGKKLPERDRLLADAQAGKLDVVVVWRFDRFARSTRDLIDALENFRTWRVEFLSLREGVDTTTAAGKLVFTIFGAIAEFEKSLIVERVRAGQEAARKRGRLPGRPRRPVDLERASAMLTSGMGMKTVARQMGIPARTFRRALVRAGRNPLSKAGPEVPEITSGEQVACERGEK